MRIRQIAPPRQAHRVKFRAFYFFAGVAESADALDSGSSECKFMRVQVPSPAPEKHLLFASAFFNEINS